MAAFSLERVALEGPRYCCLPHMMKGEVERLPMPASQLPLPREMDPAGRRPARLRMRAAARALLLWGLAAVALALAVMLTPTGSFFLLGRCAPPTDAEAARLRGDAALLLLAGAGQAAAAHVALLMPWRPLAYVAWMVATRTFSHGTGVLLRIIVCPGQLGGVPAIYFYIFSAIMFAGLVASCIGVLFGEK